MLFFPAFAVFLASGAAGASTHRLKERIHPPRDWIQVSAAPAGHIVPLRIALPQARFSELEEHLYAVSDPAHARYGAHLSKAEVEELVAPHADSLEAINAWLESFGLTEENLERSPSSNTLTTLLILLCSFSHISMRIDARCLLLFSASCS